MTCRPEVELAVPSCVSQSSSRGQFHLLTIFLILTVAVVATCASVLGQTATAISLTVTSDGKAVTSVSVGSLITITALVTAGSTAVTHGQVNFCDATSTYCTDVHLLGSAQLNSSGQAQMHLRPGVGNYSYKAMFLGTPKTTVPYAASASGSSALTVTGQARTATTIEQSGPSGDYTLTATVFGFAKSQALPKPSGTVSFVDTTTSNSLLGTASLTQVSGLGWVNISNPTAGNLPANVVAGDFNGDGNLDLAVGINSGTVSAAILLGDGIPDLLLSDASNHYLTVLLGKGDGTFTPAPGSPLISNYGFSPVAVGDFNGDGIPDVAAAGAYYLIIWLGNGDGSFTPIPTTSSYFPADSFYSMVVGDFNGDGNADMAAIYLVDEDIIVLLGNGDGTFTEGSLVPVNPISAGSPATMTMGDFNGDGKLDLAAPVYGSPGAVAIFLGQGDGMFQSAPGSPVAVGQWTNRIAVGDFNGDGVADLLVGAATSGTDVFVFLGNGDGTFAVTSTGSLSLPCCSNTVVGDFNGDGVSDFASSDFYNNTADIFLTGAKQSSTAIAGISISGQTPQNVIASYPGDGNYSSSQSNPTALLVQAAAPVFAPAPGGVIAVTQAITLTSSTPGTGIYYQASGALQTNGWIQYFAPIPVYNTGSVTIQAYAESLNSGQSVISTATYTVIASDPLPVFNSVSPAFVTAGSQGFTITVSGSGFTSMSTVYWGTTTVNTQFVSTTQLTAQITSAQVAAAGVKSITVQNPIPGGGTSNMLQFEIDSGGGTPPSFTTTSATVTAGASATYPVTLAANATNVSVKCLNLPTGASCAYSTGALTVSTSNSTPLGTYQITVVFTETLPGAPALAFAAFLFLPFRSAARKQRTKMSWVWLAILVLLVLLLPSCGGGGGGTPPPQTHQVTTSGVVTLTVQ